MGKIIWMTPPTAILLCVLSDAFKWYQHGSVFDLVFWIVIMGGLASIIWFVAYRFFTMK